MNAIITTLIALLCVTAAHAAITIPPIPDVTPGETLIVPVTITGRGSYTLEVPRLDYATYEVPHAITVNGERTVPILLHIDEKTTPGLYLLPVSANGERTAARIRVIKYEQQNAWWLVIPLGIILIIAGLILILHQQRKPKTKAPKEAEGELITYY